MANTLLAGAGGSGHAEGTTQSAVADGTIIVRDQANQQQDVNDLSRDTEHANDSISPIFNKEKEQKRLQTAQLVGEISGQMASIVNTVGDIKAMEAANEKMGPVPEGLSEKDRAAEVEKRRSSDYYQTAIRDYGIGSKTQMVVQAITGVLQGLVSGNITQAVAGGVSPLMAQTIKAYTTNPDGTTNTAANLMAHAVWGAVAAQMSGGNAAAGAGGAFSAELAARYITENYYNAKTPEEISKLSESDRQEISLLSTLAAGVAGGVIGDSTAAVTTGAQTGKNAVENNALGNKNEKPVPIYDIRPKWLKPGVLDADGEPSLAGGGIAKGGKAKDTQIWTQTKKTEPVPNAYGHWTKHGKEFPEYQNAKQYVDAAHDFMTTPPSGTLTKTRPNGDTLYYNPATNTFASKNINGVPRTMFKPEKGLEYWSKQ